MHTPTMPSFSWTADSSKATEFTYKQGAEFIDTFVGPRGSLITNGANNIFDEDAVQWNIMFDSNDPSMLDPEDQQPILYLHVTYSAAPGYSPGSA